LNLNRTKSTQKKAENIKSSKKKSNFTTEY